MTQTDSRAQADNMTLADRKAQAEDSVRADDTSRGLLRFLAESPTAFHAVRNLGRILEEAGYLALPEHRVWTLRAGGRYFTTRNGSSLIAFRIPESCGDGARRFSGYMIAASHSDSPAFKIKTDPEIVSGNAYVTLNVEKYGGMLLYPWFDRPLSVAGRILVRDGGRFLTRLVNVERDLLMIPSLAVHMDRTANAGHELNVQKELLPILGDETAKSSFRKILAETAGVPESAIAGHDLFLYPRDPGHIWGANKEFISAGRLDDLQCSYADLLGFLRSENAKGPGGIPDGGAAPETTAAAAPCLPVYAVFDNEEVGSGTRQGADSTFLSDTLERIRESLGLSAQEQLAAIAESFMISADNAHAVHPNYPEKADPVNRPQMNKGIVIKHHAGQKYTTDAVSAALFEEICRRAGVPVQSFTNRSDMSGGSTLGNISSAHVSLNTVDIGLAQLAMHSPLETAGARDTEYLAAAACEFFRSRLSCSAPGEYRLD